MSSNKISLAMAGNPNSGKSTLFNAITGTHQRVGNYPGVTVEKKVGTATHKGVDLKLVDLPGIYSLTARSIDEIVARNYILDDNPDVVIDVVDCSNLERNLYIATQFLELGVPLVLAFNMYDIAEGCGFKIDIEALSQLLGVPIVPVVGHKGRGVDQLLDQAVRIARDESAAVSRQRMPNYGHEIQPHVDQIEKMLVEKCGIDRHTRWFAVKLLEGDEQTEKRLHSICPEIADEMILQAGKLRSHVESICGDSAEIILADRRYGFISGACTESVIQTVETRHETSDKIDAILTNRYLGLPIFAALMYLVFNLTFTVGGPIMKLIQAGFGLISRQVAIFWPGDSGGILESLVLDGILGGVGGVIVFLPNILLLFLAIAFLEDTGYMARAAFIMDRLMHKLGLHGKSFIPMLIGFGCSVPAILATRTLESRRDRLTTMMIVPLMSCGARLPIYALIIPAFFPHAMQGPMLWLIYCIGIALAVTCAKILRVTVFKGQTTPFVMELPPYRMPTLKGLAIHMWERSWMYLKKAFTIILGASIVLWSLTVFPQKTSFNQDYDALIRQADRAGDVEKVDELSAARKTEELSFSLAGRIGRGMEPAIKPLGFDWRVGTALVGALAAKEVFVAQLGIVYSVGDVESGMESLQHKLQADYSRLQGFCIMLFCLISTPCVATVAATRRESNSWKWPLFQIAGLTALAYTVTLIVYQVGSLFA